MRFGSVIMSMLMSTMSIPKRAFKGIRGTITSSIVKAKIFPNKKKDVGTQDVGDPP